MRLARFQAKQKGLPKAQDSAGLAESTNRLRIDES
jgi:hypothetical protein